MLYRTSSAEPLLRAAYLRNGDRNTLSTGEAPQKLLHSYIHTVRLASAEAIARLWIVRKSTPMNVKCLLIAASLIAVPASSAFGQQTDYKQRHTVNQRSANQQARINRGVADGQITPGGAAKADANQARVNNQDARMRSRDNGHLTAADRHKLAREQNKTSKGIYDRNHNGVTDPGVPPK